MKVGPDKTGPGTFHDVKQKQALLELAERCERATGPDRGLDAAICSVIHGGPHAEDTLAGTDWWYYIDGKPVLRGREPPFTASIDAAVTLVPQGFGWWFSCGKVRPDGKPPEVNESFAQVWRSLNEGVSRGGDPHGKVATPALALCAAALRARAHA